MRSPQKNNRARGRGNRKSSGNNANRVYESAGPEGKVRGTPQQIFEKYLTLARDAQTSGDRVMGENFLQHAEHYQRLLILANAQLAQSQERRDGEQPDQNQGGESSDDASEPGAPQPSVSGSRNQGGQGQGRGHSNDQQRGDSRRGEAQDTASQDSRSEQNGAGDSSADGNRQGGGRRGESRSDEGRPQEGAAPVAGLTTIGDDSDSGENLLVAEDEMTTSQPARPRRTRTRKPAAEPAEASSDDAIPATQSES